MSIDRNCNLELELTLWGESVQGRARSWIVYLTICGRLVLHYCKMYLFGMFVPRGKGSDIM